MTPDEFRKRLAELVEQAKRSAREGPPTPPAVREVPVPFNEKAEKDEEGTTNEP